MIKPKKLQKGDTIQVISLSGGSAFEDYMIKRYKIAVGRLKTIFGLKVKTSTVTRKSRAHIYNYPEERARDFINALRDDSIAGIFLCEGGDDAIRLLRYIDYEIIAKNPKVFLGFSDGTVIHSLYQNAGVVSFYGPNLLTTLGEAGMLHEYTIRWMKKVLFENKTIGKIESAELITRERVDWGNYSDSHRELTSYTGYDVIQGKGVVSGELVGGHLGILQLMFGIDSVDQDWDNKILFIEGLVPYNNIRVFIGILRSFAARDVFRRINGMVIGLADSSDEQCKEEILYVVRDEEGLSDLPIMYGINCSHTAPMTTLPLGVLAEINCEDKSLTLLENAVE